MLVPKLVLYVTVQLVACLRVTCRFLLKYSVQFVAAGHVVERELRHWNVSYCSVQSSIYTSNIYFKSYV